MPGMPWSICFLQNLQALLLKQPGKTNIGYWFLKQTLINIELKLKNQVKTQDIAFPGRRKGRAARCSQTVLEGTQGVSIPVYGAALSREYWEDTQCIGHWEWGKERLLPCLGINSSAEVLFFQRTWEGLRGSHFLKRILGAVVVSVLCWDTSSLKSIRLSGSRTSVPYGLSRIRFFRQYRESIS